ncbi:manno-octulosonate cytidylyltransferase [Novosphingobium olei]|uniref:3-deoxy-manno-octulosonate cytidylyltransferase n=1 Tax=Novosphingobium olei TaxID=2728851 RepID=UPI0030880A37|nr:3-deoxy-manno-octulosonate cytidylyltransferase [Novosphingobium olei]
MSLPTFAIIIPARYASSRYPGKPLVALRGANGESKTLIRRSWECATAVEGCTGVWVATDDDRIADEVRSFGGNVVMTDVGCANGTERCADAIARLGDVAEVIVNLQGDAPLSPAHIVRDMVASLAADPALTMVTPAVRCSRTTYAHLAADAAEGRVGGTTVVSTRNNRALYFSKRLIPYLPAAAAEQEFPPISLHLGLYAYRPQTLRDYKAASASALEQLEGLEQLRFLDLGLAVGLVHLDPLTWDAIELNNPSDVPSIERILAERGIA